MCIRDSSNISRVARTPLKRNGGRRERKYYYHYFPDWQPWKNWSEFDWNAAWDGNAKRFATTRVGNIMAN
eukprot:5863771-Karenia_brevis.AAC.1